MSYGIRELQKEKRKFEEEKRKKQLKKEEFKIVIKEIYDTMLNYSRINNIYLNKQHPIEIGGVLFWFEILDDTKKAIIKFNRNVETWNKDYIREDLDRFFHSMYYNRS